MKKSHSKIEALKRNTSLVDYAGRHIQLQQRGAEWWGKCPFHSENSASFAIKKKGEDEVFYCQGCGKGGDIIRFVELFEKCDVKEAIARLGGNKQVQEAIPEPPEPDWNEKYAQFQQSFPAGDQGGPTQAVKEKKTLTAAQWARCETALAAAPEALAWLEKERGITAETATVMHFGFMQSIKGQLKEDEEHARDKGWIAFPRLVDGKVVAIKMRSIVCKAFSQVANMDGKALFNIETVNTLEPVFLVEGEFDAAIMEQAGYRAVSIPSASNHKLMPDMVNRLKQAPRIFLAGDNDGGVGNVAMEQLAMTLGKGTFILKWPGAKDANDFYRGPCARSTDKMNELMDSLIKVAEQTPAIGFTNVLDQLTGEEEGVDLENDPDRLHFAELQVDNMAYCPLGGIVVAYSTYTSTGKSVWVNQVAVHEAKRGEVVVSYTPEIQGREFLALLAAQTLGPTDKYKVRGIDRSGKVTSELFRETADVLRPTYDYVTRTTGVQWPVHFHPKPSDEIQFYPGYKLPDGDMNSQLDFIEYVVRVTQASRMIIDTLMRIAQPGDGESEVQAQSAAVKRFEAIAQKYHCIFILVGQSNKESDAMKEIRKDEYGVLRGSREIKDVAYSVYLLHRKKSARENSDSILENQAELILDKGRVSGKGQRRVWLEYIRKWSTFVPGTGPNGPKDAPPPEGSLQGNDVENPY